MSSFLDGSSDGSSFSQVTRITIKARMSLNFSQIPSLTTELYGVTHNAYQSLYLFFFSFSLMKISVTDISASIGASVS